MKCKHFSASELLLQEEAEALATHCFSRVHDTNGLLKISYKTIQQKQLRVISYERLGPAVLSKDEKLNFYLY